MKKVNLAITIIMSMFLICSVANAEIFVYDAEIFVYDDGTQLTVSWSPESNAFYYEVLVSNKTDSSVASITSCVFDPTIVISGLIYHNIYEVQISYYKESGSEYNIGSEYFTFALDESSGNCVCNCPEIPKEVLYGAVMDGIWTAIAINNASNESQAVVLNVGTISVIKVVPSNSVESFFLSDLLEEGDSGQYPITYETNSSEVGITVVVGTDGGTLCSQN